MGLLLEAQEYGSMRQIILQTTESPGSCLNVDMIGEKQLDVSLLGDGNGRLWRASGPGQRPHVYSYYGPCILIRVHFACVIIFPVRVNFYEPELCGLSCGLSCTNFRGS